MSKSHAASPSHDDRAKCRECAEPIYIPDMRFPCTFKHLRLRKPARRHEQDQADYQREQAELRRRLIAREVAVREELRASLGDTIKQGRIDRIAAGVLAVIANYDA